MKLVYISAAGILILVVLYFIGGTVSGDTCTSIGRHKACWSPLVKVYSGDLCTEERCNAQPETQQYNAVSTALLAACSDYRNSNDPSLESRIEEVSSEFLGLNVEANTLCNDPANFVVFRYYG